MNNKLKSISLLRSNVALTTNIKIVIDSNYNLYLESYSSNSLLSDKKYKKVLINSDSFLSERYANFFKNVPTDIAFDVKNDIKSDVIQNTYKNQYDDIYYSGAKNIEDTRYKEEFQFNTTLKIEPTNLPTNFFIFRVDDPGLDEITSDKIIPNIINDLKVVSVFDLTNKTSIGKLWKKNYIDDDKIPVSPVEFNFKPYEFSQWNGYNYYQGGTISKSFMLNDYMQNETTDFEFESFIMDSFKKNGIICSNYSNLSFLFDDTVGGIFKTNTDYNLKEYPIILDMISNLELDINDLTINTVNGTVKFKTPTPYRKKWTINRYLGFYTDEIEFIDKITTYTPVEFKLSSDIYIVNNVFKYVISGDINNNTAVYGNINPVKNLTDETTPIYIQIDKSYYLITKYTPSTFRIDEGIYIIDNVFKYIISGTAFTSTAVYGNINPIKSNNSNDQVYINLNGTYYLVKSTQVFNTITQTYELQYSIDSTEYINSDLDSIIENTIDSEYRIISDKLFNDSLDNIIDNTKPIRLVYNEIENKTYLKYNDNSTYYLNNMIEQNIEDSDIINGIFVIKINNVFYKINKDNIGYYLNTDTYITADDIYLKTKIANNELQTKLLTVKTSDDIIEYFEIYKLHFTEIADWDYNRVDTLHAKMENEKKYSVNYDRAAIYMRDLNDTTYPVDLYHEKKYNINNGNQLLLSDEFILPYSSEYAANGDLYMLDNNQITHIWDINQTVTKWGITNGIDINGSNYKINNSLTIHNVYNRTPNMYIKNVSLQYSNLDYFYSIGYPTSSTLDMLNYQQNSDIVFRTLNIDIDKTNDIISNRNQFHYFDIDFYKYNTSFDYFDYFFNRPVSFDGNKYENIDRISYLTKSDSINGPQLYFKGINGYLQYVELTDPNIPNIENVKTYPAIDLENYGFAVLFAPKQTNDNSLYGKAGIDVIINKNFKNILVNIYIYIPYGETCSIDFRDRDELYNDTFITYTSQTNVLTSELSTNGLILNTLVNILASMHTVHPEYTAGIKYEIIEPIVSYDCTINNINVMTLTNNNLNFKDGDWIFINNKNYRIKHKISNKEYELDTLDDLTSIISFTKVKSIIPFCIKILEPDILSSDTNYNKIIGDNTCPIRPVTHKNIDISDTYGLVHNNYTDDFISRNILHNTTLPILNYEDVNKLPKYYRFSGFYEPILSKIEIFNKLNINKIFTESNLNTTFDNDTIITELSLINYNKILVNDIIYFTNTIGTTETFVYKYGTVISKNTNNLITIKVNSILAGTVLDNEFNLICYRIIDKNTKFDNKYKYFGINKFIINAKVYDKINPLRTSNELNRTVNKFPMIDEHGVMVIDRNIFKSSWDSIYYYQTIANNI